MMKDQACLIVDEQELLNSVQQIVKEYDLRKTQTGAPCFEAPFYASNGQALVLEPY